MLSLKSTLGEEEKSQKITVNRTHVQEDKRSQQSLQGDQNKSGRRVTEEVERIIRRKDMKDIDEEDESELSSSEFYDSDDSRSSSSNSFPHEIATDSRRRNDPGSVSKSFIRKDGKRQGFRGRNSTKSTTTSHSISDESELDEGHGIMPFRYVYVYGCLSVSNTPVGEKNIFQFSTLVYVVCQIHKGYERTVKLACYVNSCCMSC
jgi:hypothetical protein